MVQYLSVLIEHTSLKLNQPFTYSYTGFALRPGCRVWVDFNHQKLVGFVLDISPVKPQTTYTISPIIDVMDEQPLLTSELMNIAKQYSQEVFISHIALLQAMLPPSLKPRKSSLKSPKIKFETWIELTEKKTESLNPKQVELYSLLQEQTLTKLISVRQKATLKSLLALGVIRLIEKEKYRYRVTYEQPNEILELTIEQKQALKAILSTSTMITLLQGVTGSGKTEIYISLAKEAINQNRSTLMIVPEIALTPMMVSYFGKHFKNQVAVLHSDLTPAERYDEYRKIYQGYAKVVIGARSAIFAPLSHIGYIIIDEEHSETYKQDVSPFYHVLEIATKRANYHQAKIILGSATPSLESKARANKSVYAWVELPTRIHQTQPPQTHIIDMNHHHNSADSFLFSKPLIEAMKQAIQRKEQIILLMNKRGYAQSLVCRECHHIFTCPACHLPLNVHLHSHNLKCHYCDHVETYPETCSECQSRYFNRLGFGTQRVEEEVKKLFPKEAIIRLDADTTQLRQSISKLLNAFKQQEASILIGTQMVAKGHDFPNVTVVGVVLADLGLTIPSYRSNERTFQLLTQAIGRTGRSEKPGQAFIQTYNPHHDVIRFAKTQDYEGFYHYEMRQRKLGLYPPYRYLVSLEILSTQVELLVQSADAIKSMLIAHLPNEDVLGPVTPFLEKKGPFFRRQVIVKFKEKQLVDKPLQEILTLFKSKHAVKFFINFNPLDI
jgi:primosomal protein N' (replication factor Y)